MKKQVYLDKNAEAELRTFNHKVQLEFEAYFHLLRQEGQLNFPESRKIDSNLFELRVKLQGSHRGFYAYIGKTYIIVLHFFTKKSQKTPLKHIKTAKNRLKLYE